MAKKSQARQINVEELASISSEKQRKKYVQQLESKLGDLAYWTNLQVNSIAEHFKSNPIKLQGRPVGIKKAATKRTVVSFVSDTHWGLDVNNEEVPQNNLNWQVACRRFGKYAEQVATYKIEKRGETEKLVLCLGGDLIQGIIHTSEAGTHLITTQVHGAVSILTQFIDYQRNYFPRIEVHCVPCNHARLTHKDNGVAVAQKWDAFSTMIHLGLESAFRHEKDVTFNIPMTPYTNFKIFDHEFMLTHGDTYFRVGNVSQSINIGSLTAQVNSLNASRAISGQKPVDAVLIGHVHTPLSTTLKNNTELVVNGTASGLDPYAQAIGIHSNQPIQTIFEVTKDYCVGDLRKVHLLDAGKDVRYDKIIKNNVRFLSPLNRS